MFGFFEQPQIKMQKRAAKSAKSLRELAVREMLIELRMLINGQERARVMASTLFNADHEVDARKLMAAVDLAQETIDRVGRFNDGFPTELGNLQRVAASAADYEALASFELEGREFMVAVREEAKTQIVPLGVMVMEARQVLAA